MSKKIWFKAKRYGWGWRPASWEGWLVMTLFVVFEVWNFMRLDAVSHSNSDTLRPFIIQTCFALVLLVGLCYWKGEKPSWRWGNKK